MHEPCVPTCLLSTIHLIIRTNPKSQSSMVKVQRQGPYMLRDEQLVHLSAVDLSTVLFSYSFIFVFHCTDFRRKYLFL